MFSPGDKVVCVAPEFSSCPNYNAHLASQRLRGEPSRLVTGRVYTVKAVVPTDTRDGVGLFLNEVEPFAPGVGFCTGRFRKIEKSNLTLREMIGDDNPIFVTNGA